MKKTVLILLACVMMTILMAGDAAAGYYIRVNGIWIYCCTPLNSTVIIENFESLKYEPFRVIEYSDIKGTSVCRHNNTGELLGQAWTGPEGKLRHTARFTEIAGLDGFDREKMYAQSDTTGEILDNVTADEACPNGTAFTLEDINLSSLSFVDSIYICAEYSGNGKNKVCTDLVLVDSLAGDCTWVDGEHQALCTVTGAQHFDPDRPRKGKKFE